MMVETILESSQDFGMSNGALPQWKRELLQRRAARSRPPAPPTIPPPPPPPPPNEDDEELRYGPGIVKRLKSRYLSLALRDAPRRRPSVLRRAASLEHLLDERPPCAPAARPPCALARPPRPASLVAPPATLALHAPRRESVKRARSVDALSRLEARDEPQPPSPSPPPQPPASRPPQPRSARPPRRPTPLLRETERPPPDVVRSTLRKFESAPSRRTAPAARVSAVLRGLEAGPRGSTPEPRDAAEPARTPSPLTTSEPTAFDDGVTASAEARLVSRAALEGIARAGSTVRYAFEAPLAGSHLPPLAATNPVLVGRARRVGVIRPMPAPERAPPSPPPHDIPEKISDSPPVRVASSPPPETEPSPPPRIERRDQPPSALVEPIPRTPEFARLESPRSLTPVERVPTPEPKVAPELKQTPELKLITEPKLISDIKLVPEHKLSSEIKSTPELKLVAEQKLFPEVKSTPELKLVPEQQLFAEIKSTPEPKITTELKLLPEQKLYSEIKSTPGLKLTPDLKQTPELKLTPEIKQTPELKLTKSVAEPIVELLPVTELKSIVEVKSTPSAHSTPKANSISVPTVELKKSPEIGPKPVIEVTTPLLNGYAVPESNVSGVISRIGAAGIERAWSGSVDKKPAPPSAGVSAAAGAGSPAAAAAAAGPAWARGSPAAPRRPRAPPPAAANSIVFNFSNRKEVPDYIENDGLILRASRRNRFKAGEAGVVVLRSEAGEPREEPASEEDDEPDSALAVRVRFLNDNVLINGRSSMPARPDKDRIAKLKLQFDDSLTRTFEYPSETSLCEEAPSPAASPPASSPAAAGPASAPGAAGPAGAPAAPSQQLAEPAVMAPLAANTHITSAALSQYTPSKTAAAAFQLGVTRHHHYHDAGSHHQGEGSEREQAAPPAETHAGEGQSESAGGAGGAGERDGAAGERDGEAAACAGLARSWSEARTHRTDLLF